MSQKRSLEAMNGDETLLANASTESLAQQCADLNGATDSNLPKENSSLKETILDLKWSVRNDIISNLYSHSSYLIKKISDNLKEEKMKANFELMQTLLNLPAANYETDRPKKRTKLDVDDAKSGEIILDLSWTDRDLIVDNLLKNHHCAIMYSSLVPRSVKDGLTKENNQLVSILTNLRVRKTEEEEDEVIMDKESNDGAAAKSEEQIIAKENDDELDKTNNQGLVEIDTSKVVADIADMRKELLIVREIGKFLLDKKKKDRKRTETTFSFKVPLSKLDEKEPIFSPLFACSGIQWSVKVYSKTKDFADWLNVFVQPELKLESVEVAAEVRLINVNPSSTIKKQFDHTFTKPMPAGFADYIEMFTLDQKNGFLNNNSEIELEIYLKVTNNKSLAEI